ncbi:DUF4290 domain-containing protein [Parasediminibacterium sp. JCM 36343]|uniref:DUF4290 domain-containing protein n=1 Tax=Parasediminibacterium sp. JCM 36343 TaxID=3374279 RepID=UPI003979824F
MNLLQYNTSRKIIGLREYGRHIQRMVDYLLTIEDREERNQQAKSVIELMGFLNPHLKNVEDFRHMLWDHLFAISDFKLDVDSPYPIPQKETYKLKGNPMHYPGRNPKYAHLGKNIELVIDKALQEEDPEKRAGFANSIAYYMKLSYSNWHKESVHDDAIRSELSIMTKGELELSSATGRLKQTSFDREELARNSDRKQNFGNRAGGDTKSALNVLPTRGNGRDNRGNTRDAGLGNRSSTSSARPDSRSPISNRTPANRNFKKRF